VKYRAGIDALRSGTTVIEATSTVWNSDPVTYLLPQFIARSKPKIMNKKVKQKYKEACHFGESKASSAAMSLGDDVTAKPAALYLRRSMLLISSKAFKLIV
jgi:hypothetical protein